MSKNIKKKVKLEKNISYLNRDFESFRKELIQYSRINYPDKINDFTESGLGGLFVDMAAYVGDVMSFYLDHQFNELSLVTAVEEKNIERLIKTAGVNATPKSPSTAVVEITVTIPTKSSGDLNLDLLPIVKSGTLFGSKGGVDFLLLENVDFSKLNETGAPDVKKVIGKRDSNGNILDYKLTKSGVCTSAKMKVDTFSIGNDFRPFRKIELREDNISEIIFVKDSAMNTYYEVENLAQDTVFKRIANTRPDSELVSENLLMLPAPRRFIREYSRQTGKTSLRFGSGREEVYDNDVIPDPSEHALALYGDRKTFSSVTIDPNKFLETQTLGVSPRNTVITIAYRYGGGLSDNVSANSVSGVKILNLSFAITPTHQVINSIRGSVSAINPQPAGGGEDEPTLNELRSVALNIKNSQNRIVSKSDLLARVYTLPNNFGRVFRAGIADNPNNPLATQLFIISRDKNKKLIISPDSLKINLVTYLNKYRLISDAIDIVDANVINLALAYSIAIEPGYNYQSILNKINSELKDYFKLENFQIGQPIIISDISNLILNMPGVLSLVTLKWIGRGGSSSADLRAKGFNYSTYNYDPSANVSRGMLIPPTGGMFEIRYPQQDLIGRVV